jgi:sec-independent protein translocase protein TatC
VRRIRKAAFEEAMPIVDHLDELRTRIMVCVAVLVVAVGLCFWQNHLLLSALNVPLPPHRSPLTLSPTEPFLITFKISAYAGVILALPILLYQGYAFFMPALAPAQRRTLVPFLALVPFLFVAGVIFGYFVVLPAAIKFLLNFNADQFNVQVRATDYYSFATLTLLSMGAVFQVPMGILALTRLGVTTPAKLRKSRRYAYLVLAVVAMLLPGTDPVTMMIELVPLLALYEVSIVLARLLGTPASPAVPSGTRS